MNYAHGTTPRLTSPHFPCRPTPTSSGSIWATAVSPVIGRRGRCASRWMRRNRHRFRVRRGHQSRGARPARIHPSCLRWGALPDRVLYLVPVGVSFPQHGPGRKHHRRIELADWQQKIVDAAPQEFLRGLIHTDGWRGINRVYVKGKHHEYPRYRFSNRSDDIRKLFTDLRRARRGVESVDPGTMTPSPGGSQSLIWTSSSARSTRPDACGRRESNPHVLSDTGT
jgi:hypothetical protein